MPIEPFQISDTAQGILLGYAKRTPRRTRLLTVDGGPYADITFDATTSLDDSNKATVTRHPVETGVTITDHVTVDPRTVSLRAVFSDTPLPIVPFEKDAVQARLGLASLRSGVDQAIAALATTTNGGVADNSYTRAEQFYDVVVQMLNAARVVGIDSPGLNLTSPAGREARNRGEFYVASLSDFGSFVITSVRKSKTAKTGMSVEVDVTLDEIRIVSTERGTLPVNDLVMRLKEKASGKKATEEPTAAQEAEINRTVTGQGANLLTQ